MAASTRSTKLTLNPPLAQTQSGTVVAAAPPKTPRNTGMAHTMLNDAKRHNLCRKFRKTKINGRRTPIVRKTG
eukprot:11179133-Lingulodinium_polyedra.AAC.1